MVDVYCACALNLQSISESDNVFSFRVGSDSEETEGQCLFKACNMTLGMYGKLSVFREKTIDFIIKNADKLFEACGPYRTLRNLVNAVHGVNATKWIPAGKVLPPDAFLVQNEKLQAALLEKKEFTVDELISFELERPVRVSL